MNSVLVWLFALCALAALLRRVPLSDTLFAGIRDGLHTLLRIFPTVMGVLSVFAMLRASGALPALEAVLRPLLARVGIPPETVPLMLIRPLSGSASLGVVQELLQRCGADSAVGKTASVMLASTETALYTLSLYGTASGAKQGKALAAALLASLSAFCLAPFFVRLCLRLGG